MNTSNKLYGNEFNPNVLKDVKTLNEQIEKETDPEKITKLKMQRLCRGMELNTGYNARPYGGYYPY